MWNFPTFSFLISKKKIILNWNKKDHFLNCFLILYTKIILEQNFFLI